MTPVSREEMYLYKLAGGSVTVPTPVSRKEMYLAKACGAAVTAPDPVSREEMYLYKLAGGTITLPTPVSRLELLMAAACGEAVVPYDPVSRIEWFWSQIVSPTQTITGVPPIAFTSDGTPLSICSIYGNGQQTGTPSPDNILMPTFCGNLVGTDWTIPITCAGQTTHVYLGQTQTVRRIKKLALTGDENWTISTAWKSTNTSVFYTIVSGADNQSNYVRYVVSDRFISASRNEVNSGDTDMIGLSAQNALTVRISDNVATTVTELQTYLATQYAAGTPVTVWYVLAEPTTGITNEPLAKIGDYADELHSADAGVTIQTVSGSNTLTIGTDLQPSSVSITGHISQ